MEPRWFVLGARDSESPFLLYLQPRTEQEAIRAIHWQRKGQGQLDGPSYWQRATFDEKTNRFYGNDGNFYAPDIEPYTVEAWEVACREIGYRPPNERKED